MVLYTFRNSMEDLCVLVIEDDLDTVPNPLSCEVALYQPQTPDMVRTMYYNSIAHVVRWGQEEEAVMANEVRLHQQPDGTYFLEVELTPAGKLSLERMNQHAGPMYYFVGWKHFDPQQADAKKTFEKDFTRRLKSALKCVGLAPKGVHV